MFRALRHKVLFLVAAISLLSGCAGPTATQTPGVSQTPRVLTATQSPGVLETPRVLTPMQSLGVLETPGVLTPTATPRVVPTPSVPVPGDALTGTGQVARLALTA